MAAQNDDAVGQQNGFLNIVGDEENAAGGNFLAEPQLQQLAAQVLGGENVERGKRLIHEKDFGFHGQRARETHALFHAAGEFFGIGILETMQSHRRRVS